MELRDIECRQCREIERERRSVTGKRDMTKPKGSSPIFDRMAAERFGREE